jgi:hypothetical protein
MARDVCEACDATRLTCWSLLGEHLALVQHLDPLATATHLHLPAAQGERHVVGPPLEGQS